MTIEQIRARLADISALLATFVAGDEGYSQEQVEEINTLNEEFEGLTVQLETAEKVEAMKAKAVAPTGRKTVPAQVENKTQIQVGRNLATDRFGGFNSVGDYLMAVKRAGASGEVDKRFQNVAYEKNGEDGGFLVPEELSSAILEKLKAQDSLLAQCNQLTVSGNNLTLPVDEAQPWNQGVTAYWTAEGAAITASKNALKEASWKLHKLAALVPVTDELLDDATAMESWIRSAAPAAIVSKVNDAIISGNGVGKPTGIIQSPFAVTVAAEGGQTADTVVAKNIIKMFPRMIPQARAGAVWLINSAVEEQLMGMKDDADQYIYLAPGSQMNQSPYATLMGKPVISMMSAMPALGDVGDIMFANLSYYYAILKASGVKSATSIHLQFDREITNFRFSFRIDGKCPFQAPVSTQYGSYNMSAFVMLAAR